MKEVFVRIKKWSIKKYFQAFLFSIFTITLVSGFVGPAGNTIAASNEVKMEELSKKLEKLNSGANTLEKSLELISEYFKQSVVSVTTIKVFKHPTKRFHGDGYGGGRGGRDKRRNPFNFFGDDFLDRFVPKPPQGEYKSRSLGSGVIVRVDGKTAYILTNNHVVADMDELKVKLNDKREFDAEIVGTDEQTDLAVIKIEGKNFVPAKMGDSDNIRPGHWAVAVGNPFGLSNTVSLGVVSAVGRSGVGIAQYENFIQTDAAINPGNSGGPLVNIRGDIIGINTAIFTRTGGYQGIGFAIPINMAKAVLRDLIDKGRVVRGWLGVVIQDINPSLAEQFKVDITDGVLISDVQDGSPASDAGFKRGDIVVEYNGKMVSDVNHLRNIVAQTEVGKKIKIRVLRGGKDENLTVKIGEQPSDLFASAQSPIGNDLGLTVQDLTKELADNLGYEGENGVIVTSIVPGSPASEAGIKEGDLIKETNREKINDVKEFKVVLKKAEKSRDVLLLIRRGMHTRFVIIKNK